MFGFWQSDIWDMAPEAVLVDKDWQPAEAGAAYDRLLTGWATDVSTTIGADGAAALTGAFGDYDLEVGGKTPSSS